MSHHIYHTDSFVLGSTPVGEGSGYVALFTQEHGLVNARAQSVREERSKLRYGLQHFSLAHVSLIRGRDVWRIVGAEERANFYTTCGGDREKQLLIARVFSLVRRLCAGEEKNERLFTIMRLGCAFIVESELTKDALSAAECVLALRILKELGYVGGTSAFREIVSSDLFSHEVLSALSPHRRDAIREINRALEASHL